MLWGTSLFSTCSDVFFLWFPSRCRAVVWVIAVAWPVQSRKRLQSFPGYGSLHCQTSPWTHSQAVGPSLQPAIVFPCPDDRMWRAKADPIHTAPQGTSKQGLSQYEPWVLHWGSHPRHWHTHGFPFLPPIVCGTVSPPGWWGGLQAEALWSPWGRGRGWFYHRKGTLFQEAS